MTSILIVDSGEPSRQALSQAFANRGHQVLEAADTATALAILARESVRAVVMDVTAEGDWREALRAIRRGSAELPVVMLTEAPDQSDAVAAVEEGATDCIPKPALAAVVAARLETQLRLHAAVATARRASPPPEPPLSPSRLGPGVLLAGKYQIESKIGTGAFGTVYKARHLDLDVGVAVKVLQRELAATADARARLQREAISACRIQHPNAVTVMDFGIQGEVVYLVMELLTGRSLEDELGLTGRLAVARAIELALPVLSVLATAHAAGILHRDVKPANIFLHHTPRGEVVKVLDFGIAKLLDSPQQTTVGVVLGTPAFMPPERFTGGTSSPSGDVYSLGTMLFQMLTGRLPFVPDGRDPMVLAELKVKHDPPSLRALVPEIPEAVEAVVLKALARKPQERPTAADLAEALAEVMPQAVAAGDTSADAAADGSPGYEPEPTAVLPALDIRSEPETSAEAAASADAESERLAR